MIKKSHTKKLLIICVLTAMCSLSFAQSPVKLSNKKASREARALYSYLLDINGKKTLSGQMDVKWGEDELKYLQEVTGKQPAIRGMDFIDSAENENEITHAIEWWREGGIPTIMWHWGAPTTGQGYDNSKKEIDIEKCFEEGTPENIAMWAELKEKARLLKKLKNAKVPVLWRPFHEMNGTWFWWGKQGPEQFKKLWITMYNYFVKEEKLNNLIWVLGYTSKPDAAWYPGDEYVDITGADDYGDDSPHKTMYEQTKQISSRSIPIAYHECGIPPDPDKCLAEGVVWSWWMEWHTGHLTALDKEYLKRVYNHDLIITLDEVPNIMKKYGK
ncbi:glycoside hydrolase family 26 protein [Mucilaginibacter sp. UR6-1]|uniref:glycosyl hydrolase n=1 Tax=Mucilaginibacter sp. UR6-1 TaxID=1435643 RepID=UPI001E31F5E8|nr:glycosyl hydrolase [Mucilaginibacter sp. UR6-1]MCC8408034.1 glycoside hydrolase family 26 protein [Mucilaginibacter sp. UR6-1]